MAEVLARREDYYGRQWIIQKEATEGFVTISVIKCGKSKPDEVVSAVRYRDIGYEYKSSLLDWENLIFCSNNYGVAPIYDYMHKAVQIGKKTAATVYLAPDSQEAKQLIASLPKECDWREYGSNMIFVFHTGCLADYFDFTEIKAVYDDHGVGGIDWTWVEEQFRKPLSYFAEPEACGFSLQSGGGKEISIVTGLILWYPLESTVYWLGGN